MTFPFDQNTGGQAELADVELAHEDRVGGPAGAAYAPPAEPPFPAAAADGSIAVDDVTSDRWSTIQAMFVDDPRGSIAKAASLVDEAIEAFITAVRDRQASLASSWQAQDGDTEQLRAAFHEYRAFWNRVTGLPQAL